MTNPTTLRLIVQERRALTPSISEFVLAAEDGAELPGFEPGAHITVETPSRAMRRYSLVNDGEGPSQYVIAVKREPASRGGSASMHENAAAGSVLAAFEPNNQFELTDAPSYLLIAGGIGITPILPMAKRLHSEQKSFRLIYCTRSADDTAYLDDIRAQFGNRAVVHHDDGHATKSYDFWDELMNPGAGHVFCCGPAPMMEDIKGMSGHWPEGRVHFEDFNPVDVVRADDVAFSVTLTESGQVVPVPADRSILEALRDAGVDTVSSCESGTCGTCKATLVRGLVDHRDMVLEDAERPTKIMICVSRAQEGDLAIEL